MIMNLRRTLDADFLPGQVPNYGDSSIVNHFQRRSLKHDSYKSSPCNIVIVIVIVRLNLVHNCHIANWGSRRFGFKNLPFDVIW